ncbi:MAG: hypothetical protein JOZ05_08620, partial [Acetobacteraceae bacterium]|nr:hypothetical protein [Acetobacteraceae bacterium]
LPVLPKPTGLEPPGQAVRAVVNGEACGAVVEALTSRRFRRNACYREDDLRRLVQDAIMAGRSAEFLMFWGCGPRSVAGAPDHIAIEALADLLASVRRAAPLDARVDIVCTDGHATNNGHSVAHYRSYFGSVQRAAAKLNATFHLESEVWRAGGLSKAMVSAFEATADFIARWERFALRDRFVRQAGRHSRITDQVAAARHYYATCLLERDLLKARFGNSVFLTYNGPEFNECFPDLPTLYIYPGPRGRTDKPWFVHDGAELDLSPASGLAVAAE